MPEKQTTLEEQLREIAAATPPVDRSRVHRVEAALEETIVAMCEAARESHSHDAEVMAYAAKAIGMTFGCWRSLQTDLDRGIEPPIIDLGSMMQPRPPHSEEDESG